MASKSKKPAVAHRVVVPIKSTPATTKPDAPAVDQSERSAHRQAALTPSQVAVLGLRNGMTPDEINARIDSAYPED